MSGALQDYRRFFDLQGQVALVMGGGGSLGKEIAIGLGQNGVEVVIVDLNLDSAEEVAQMITAQGGKAIGRKVNMLAENELRALVEELDQLYGRLDVLVNAGGTMVWQKAEDFTEENWDKVLDINLKGIFLTCREVGRLMLRQRQGKIMSISSVRGKLGFPENYTAYCASKGGLNLYTKCLAAEWAKYNINVNAIAPTFVRTSLTEGMLSDPKTHDMLLNRIPLHRLGTPADIVGAALFLASRASDFITGHILYVDGGVTCTQ